MELGDIGVHDQLFQLAVSAADLAVEAALVETISRERPGDAVLSEERGGAARSDGRRWILDPVDGTEPFLAHELWWGTHIALEQEGEVVVAVMTRPAAGQVEIDEDLAIIPAVAEGRLDAVVDPGAGLEWDHAAQELVVTEAGGSFYDAHGGQRIDTGVGIYTNGRIDEELLARLATFGIGPGPTKAR